MDIDTHADLKTKSDILLTAIVTHTEMMRALETFKEAKDECLG